jgi:hypothetical protein
MSRAREFADLAGSADAGGLSGRNLIINGDQRIAQRGTDLNGKKENVYIADRYILRTYNASSVGAFDYDQVTDTVPDGFKYSTKLTVATAATDVGTYGYAVEQRVEGYNMAHLRLGRSDAKSFTVSFWARSSVAGTYTSSVRTTSAEYSYVTTFTLVADTWKYVSYTVPVLTSSLSNLDETNASGLIFQIAAFGSQTSKETSTLNSWQSGNFTFATTQTNWMGTLGNTFHFTGVQIEVGDKATPFEHRSYGDELARCQRYFYAMNSNTSTGTSDFINASGYSASQANAGVDLPVTMRATPTQSFGNDTGAYRFYRSGGNDSFDTLASDGQSNLHLQFAGIAGLSHTSGVAGSMQIRYADGGYIHADAEL